MSTIVVEVEGLDLAHLERRAGRQRAAEARRQEHDVRGGEALLSPGMPQRGFAFEHGLGQTLHDAEDEHQCRAVFLYRDTRDAGDVDDLIRSLYQTWPGPR